MLFTFVFYIVYIDQENKDTVFNFFIRFYTVSRLNR